ncbi:hypothetical protein ACOQFB_03590 [Anaeromyxobacter sp. Red801]|uniref:hypothetical protein n=1 Tax=Anaeromyxobacter sp. Red801 TaxID=3411632 RepID=UPI003BA0A108
MAEPSAPLAPPPMALLPEATAIESAPITEVTSDGLGMLKDLILRVRAERAEVTRAIPKAQEELAKAQRRLRNAQSWLLGLFLKRRIPERRSAVAARTAELGALHERLAGAFVDAEFANDSETGEAFEQLTQAFVALAGCVRIWDITSKHANDRCRTRSSADRMLDRRPVQFTVVDGDEVLKTPGKRLRLQNANGADLVVCPAFLLLQNRSELALIDLREVNIEYSTSRFIEQDGVPSDAAVVEYTWAKCNKDGSADRRFRENYQIPVTEYAQVGLSTQDGLNEQYMFSSVEKAQGFARALRDYQTALRRLGDRVPSAVNAPRCESPRNGENAAGAAALLAPSWKSVDFIRSASAVSVEDAVQTMTHFAQLLQQDLQALNGECASSERWGRFVADCQGVTPAVFDYFARSPAAIAVEQVVVKEVGKMLRSALGQIESDLDAMAARDPDVQALLARVRDATNAIQA